MMTRSQHIPAYFLVLILVLTLFSCGKDRWEEYYPRVYKSMWVDSILRADYLYRSDLPEKESLTSSYFLEPEAFLKKVLPSHDKFSRVDSINNGKLHDQGLRFTWVPLEGGSNGALVYMVDRGSAAEGSGIERGDWIISIDGDSITENEKPRLSDGDAHELVLAHADSSVRLTPYRLAHLPQARTYKRSSLQAINRFSTGSHEVAYLCLTHLDSQALGEIEDQGREIYMETCDYLVMDLRYADTGDMESMRILAGMVDSRNRAGSPLAVLKHASERGIDSTTVLFPSIEDMGMLPFMDLKGVYFLVSGQTQAEAEILINCLRPHISTTIIGLPTKGQAVTLGSYQREDIGLTLRPVTAHVANYMGEATYEGIGLEPELRISETEHLDLIRPLGDKDEVLLSVALHDISQR